MSNRIIKFRAWDIVSKKFIKPETVFLFRDGTFEEKDVTIRTINQQYEQFFLQQFTGLKDKNGKEIYEGDIINFDGSILLIKWFTHGFGYEILKPEDPNVIEDIRLYRTDESSKIIGNIYENPELIK